MQSILAYERNDVVAAVRAQRARTIALLEQLQPDEWETIVTPGWRAREVAAHLVSSDEAALTGRMMVNLGMRQVPIGELESWNDRQVHRWADRPIPAILHGLDRWGRVIARAIATAPRRLVARPIPTPLGKVSLGWVGMMRVYDEWIHGEDIRRVFGYPSDDGPAVVEPVARHMLAVIPIQTLSRIPAGATGRVTIAYRDFPDLSLTVDLGARRFGVALEGPSTRVTGMASDLVMVAAGRDQWREAESAGSLVIDGPREPAEAFLDVLLAV